MKFLSRETSNAVHVAVEQYQKLCVKKSGMQYRHPDLEWPNCSVTVTTNSTTLKTCAKHHLKLSNRKKTKCWNCLRTCNNSFPNHHHPKPHRCGSHMRWMSMTACPYQKVVPNKHRIQNPRQLKKQGLWDYNTTVLVVTVKTEKSHIVRYTTS